MMRWLEELRYPELKCARVGHKRVVEVREGYVKDPDRYYVCVRVRDERQACGRCGAALGGWEPIYRKGLTGMSWPTEMDIKFERDGELWERHSTYPVKG